MLTVGIDKGPSIKYGRCVRSNFHHVPLFVREKDLPILGTTIPSKNVRTLRMTPNTSTFTRF